jgi:predicted transglutaminase-like cysteine proteinase
MRSRNILFIAALLATGTGPQTWANPTSEPAAYLEHSALAPPNVFGSVALPVTRSRYSARWLRAASPSQGDLPSFIRVGISDDRGLQARMVNVEMNRHIRYSPDRNPSDSWATARETLSRSAGDCEDIAIAKMQALLALGVPSSDLFMTIGSDTAAGAVHALLLVRIDGRFWVLDNRVERPVPQEDFKQFYPILTFSGNRTWLHGYRPGNTPESVNALSYAAASGNLQVGGLRSSSGTPRRS